MQGRFYDWWWKKYEEKTIQLVTQEIQRIYLEKPGKNVTLLDIGSGTSNLAQALTHLPIQIHAVEPDKHMLSHAEKKDLSNTTHIHQSAETYQYPDTTYDVVVSCSAYHRYKDKQSFLHNAYNTLKQGGHLIILDWNNTGWFKPVHKTIQLFDPNHVEAENTEQIKQRLRETPLTLQKCNTYRTKTWKLQLITATKTQT